MNTSQVAKLLGVSPKTVQRWVKQLNLQMERNELGHYLFTDEDINTLRDIKDQLNQGILFHEVKVTEKKPPRIGIVKTEAAESGTDFDELLQKIAELGQKVNSKADSVVSYQLLQHRREIEELNERITELEAKIESFEKQKDKHPIEHALVFDHIKTPKKQKRRNFISSIFSF
ncbi:MerR family transcriptional regulator [Bacillus sp. V2I10]|uniref:MerR family transcriptional regulator n=1 Tax=Bacillus sp. V2I10 TaxID=3042276 RepID=UPI00277E1DFB|nr:MerR family transcriptional regulator [Bacillus sp. V2I10]MDQ0857044.1 chromosome-anchoring protein RacA [Bacillus sp. V2I10]